MAEQRVEAGRLRTPRASEAYFALQRARRALLGDDDPGSRPRSTMFDADVVSFAHGEGVRRAYPEALAAIARALHDPDAAPLENYMFLRRFPALEAAIGDEMVSAGVPRTAAANVVVDAGTTRLIIAALDLMTEPGDTVVTFSGFYHPLAAWCAYRNLDFRVVPTSAEEGHRPSAARLEAALAARPCRRPPVLLLFNPTMTGALCGREEIEAIAAVVARRGMWAIEDALFANCEFDESARSARLAATAAGERVLTVAGASKLHGLANMRIGWGCGAQELIGPLRDFVTAGSATIPHLAKVAALEALRAPADYTRRNVQEVRERLDLIAETIVDLDARLRAETGRNAPLVRVAHRPQAGHSLLLDFGGFAEAARAGGLAFADSADLTRWFLDESKVAFSPAQSHGFGGFHLRVNVASVGTRLTYPASVAVEAAWDGRWSPAHAAAYEEGFAEGRAMIAEALTRRVEPAMRRALHRAPVASQRTVRPDGAHVVRGLEEAVSGCEAVLMDVWGVLTDGTRPFEQAVAALVRLSGSGRPVVLVSNTSRRGRDLAVTLSALGFPDDLWASIVTGGDLAYACAGARRIGDRVFGDRVHVLGMQPGGHWAREAGLVVVDDVDDADVLLGVGVLEDERVAESDLATLRRAAARGLPFLVSNADAQVRLGDRLHAAVGALAPHYHVLGGEAHVFGKPHRAIFAKAAAQAAAALGRRALDPEKVLVVGDSLATDVAGAAALGARTLLVTATGIHGAELHPEIGGPVCADALRRLCSRHDVRPDMALGGLAW
ncbi:TIGR01459 family HAD-type hydrolase [Salinarimonas chemoclinalis]|uniref:TIGR01459 family HAD-type hydrolase n=1 Tax=Salinarimonas chemoclinalis TaxID=3241599 RepID=UPI0035575F88